MKKANLLTKMLMLVLAFAMVLQMTACGGGSTDGKKDTAGAGTSKPAEPERVQQSLFEKRENADADIDMLIWWPPKSDIQEINALYQKTYGGKVNGIEKAWGQMTSTLSSYVAAGTPAEVVLCGPNEVPLWAAQGLLQEIPMDKINTESEYWDMETMSTTYSVKGKTYALS